MITVFFSFQNDRHFTETELELIAKNDKINQIQDENSILQTTIKDLQDENSILQTTVKDLQDENSILQTTIKDLQDENSIFRMTSEGVENQIKQLAKQLDHQTTQNEKFKSQIQLIVQKIGIVKFN